MYATCRVPDEGKDAHQPGCFAGDALEQIRPQAQAQTRVAGAASLPQSPDDQVELLSQAQGSEPEDAARRPGGQPSLSHRITTARDDSAKRLARIG